MIPRNRLMRRKRVIKRNIIINEQVALYATELDQAVPLAINEGPDYRAESNINLNMKEQKSHEINTGGTFG